MTTCGETNWCAHLKTRLGKMCPWMSLFHVIINPVTSIRYTKSAYNRFTFATHAHKTHYVVWIEDLQCTNKFKQRCIHQHIGQRCFTYYIVKLNKVNHFYTFTSNCCFSLTFGFYLKLFVFSIVILVLITQLNPYYISPHHFEVCGLLSGRVTAGTGLEQNVHFMIFNPFNIWETYIKTSWFCDILKHILNRNIFNVHVVAT